MLDRISNDGLFCWYEVRLCAHLFPWRYRQLYISLSPFLLCRKTACRCLCYECNCCSSWRMWKCQGNSTRYCWKSQYTPDNPFHKTPCRKCLRENRPEYFWCCSICHWCLLPVTQSIIYVFGTNSALKPDKSSISALKDAYFRVSVRGMSCCNTLYCTLLGSCLALFWH